MRQNNGVQKENRYSPHVTVATVVEKNREFLMVEEQIATVEHTVFNQPAGHLEPNETLIQAAIRETLEETCWQVKITGYLGVFMFKGDNDVDYIRHAFIGEPLEFADHAVRDAAIIGVHWLNSSTIHHDLPLRHNVVSEVLRRAEELQILPLKGVTTL